MRERARAGSPNSSSLIPFDYSALDATAGFAVYFSCFLGMQLPSSSVIFSYPNHMSCVPPIYSHCACKSVGCWCWLLLLFCFFFHFGSLFFLCVSFSCVVFFFCSDRDIAFCAADSLVIFWAPCSFGLCCQLLGSVWFLFYVIIPPPFV